MAARCRSYHGVGDFEAVGRFLVRTCRREGPHVNWVQPRWEYMHYHPLIRGVDVSRIGVWEAGGEIVAVAHPEHEVGTAYIEVDPDRPVAPQALLEYAETCLSVAKAGMSRVGVFIHDRGVGFQRAAAAAGYARTSDCEDMSYLPIPSPFPDVPVPDGFQIRSLADDCDIRKITRVLRRGFNHAGEPSEEDVEDRRFMQSAPNFREDLNIIIEGPDGEFVSYCGMWYEPHNGLAYVEPVCTDPDYRRRRLARAAVLEGIRRCGELGATLACVGSVKPLYRSVGFQWVYRTTVWAKECANRELVGGGQERP